MWPHFGETRCSRQANFSPVRAPCKMYPGTFYCRPQIIIVHVIKYGDALVHRGFTKLYINREAKRATTTWHPWEAQQPYFSESDGGLSKLRGRVYGVLQVRCPRHLFQLSSVLLIAYCMCISSCLDDESLILIKDSEPLHHRCRQLLFPDGILQCTRSVASLLRKLKNPPIFTIN